MEAHERMREAETVMSKVSSSSALPKMEHARQQNEPKAFISAGALGQPERQYRAPRLGLILGWMGNSLHISPGVAFGWPAMCIVGYRSVHSVFSIRKTGKNRYRMKSNTN